MNGGRSPRAPGVLPGAARSATAGVPSLPVPALRYAFDLGNWRDVKQLPGGKSQHYLLTTARGRFVLRRSYSSKRPEGIRFEHELVAHLRAGGFPAPEFVPTVEGGPCAEIGGRLWRVSVYMEGTPGDGRNPEHVAAVGHALAWFHELAAGFRATVPAPDSVPMPVALRERLGALQTGFEADDRPSGSAAGVQAETAAPGVLSSLRFALREAVETVTRLDDLYPALPVVTTHGGCRRGSALFNGDRLLVMLDFDSAHPDVRALDIAVAVHDFAKIYGDPSSPDFKVHLDSEVAHRFLAAYASVRPLLPSEIEVLPVLLVAKRLKRALGRYCRLLAGEALSVNDLRKIAMELERVRSLHSRFALLP